MVVALRIRGFFHRNAARACAFVALAVGALLLIGAVANAAPPGGFPATDQRAGSLVATATTTALAPLPVSPVAQGTMVMLTATVTPATAAGTVQFKDVTTDLGKPVIVSNGTALGLISQLPAGSHQLVAVFTPTDPGAFSGSMSPTVPFVVTASPSGPMATNTALTASPVTAVAQDTPVTLIATVAPATAVGTVQFKDGTADVASPVAVSSGTASVTTLLAAGSRELTAVFTPSDPAAFAASRSSAVSVPVAGPQAQQSGQSLDGQSGGLTVLDLGGTTGNGGTTDGRGVTVLDLDGLTGNGGTTGSGGTTDRRGVTVLDGRGLTILRGGDRDRGLLGGLLHDLL